MSYRRCLLSSVFSWIVMVSVAAAQVNPACPSASALSTSRGSSYDQRIVNVSSFSQLLTALDPANLQSGDTIVLADGTYTMTSSLFITSAASGGSYSNSLSHVTIRGNGPGCDGVVIQGGGQDTNGPGQYGLQTDLPYWTVAHLTIRDNYISGIFLNANNTVRASNFWAYQVKVLNSGEQHVKVNPPPGATDIVNSNNNGVFEYGVIAFTSAMPTTDHGGGVGYWNGIDIHRGQNWTIRDTIFRNAHEPDSVNSGNWFNGAILLWNCAGGTLVERNYFIDVDQPLVAGLLQTPACGTNDSHDTTIRNNAVWISSGFFTGTRIASADGAFRLWNAPNTLIYNNTVMVHGNFPASVQARWSVTIGVEVINHLSDAGLNLTRDSACGSGCVQTSNYASATDAYFASTTPGAVDFLDLVNTGGAATNAIDQGATIVSVTEDIHGTSRPQGSAYDRGSMEFVSGDTMAPAAPTNLRVISP